MVHTKDGGTKAMKGKRFTEEQIGTVLKEGQAGLGVGELCRKYGISEATYYHWKAKYATVSDLRKLKALEEENRRLKGVVADQALDIQTLKHLLSKNWDRPQ